MESRCALLGENHTTKQCSILLFLMMLFSISQSPSIIQPAPHWWERGPEVMTFIPPAQETSVTDSVRGELGVEFPYALGKQVEELMADHWEEMQKTG